MTTLDIFDTILETQYRAVIEGEHVGFRYFTNGPKEWGCTAFADDLAGLRVELDRDWCSLRTYYGEACSGCEWVVRVFEKTVDVAKPVGERWVSEREVTELL